MEELNAKFSVMLEKIGELTEGVNFLGSKYEELKTSLNKTIDNQEVLNKSLVKALKENNEQKKKKYLY